MGDAGGRRSVSGLRGVDVVRASPDACHDPRPSGNPSSRARPASVDKQASEIVERLLRRASAAELRAFASRLEGYVNYLFGHRYSSHVMQTLLSRAGAVIAEEEARFDMDTGGSGADRGLSRAEARADALGSN